MTNETRYIFEDDPLMQRERVEVAYSRVIEEGRGVVISKEMLEKYRAVSNDPAQRLITVVKNYYAKNLKSKKVCVAINNGVVVITFENDGARKSVGWRMTPEKAATFEQLEQLLENGIYAYSQVNTNAIERERVPLFHYLVNNANIDGVDVPVKIVIRELVLAQGLENRYYTHTLVGEKGGVGPGLRKDGVADVSNTPLNSGLPSIQII